METSTEAMEALSKRSLNEYRASQRFNAVVQSVVAYTLNRYGPIDPDEANRAAYDIAMEVAAMMLQAVYEEDREIKNLKAEADHCRKLAESALAYTVIPPKVQP